MRSTEAVIFKGRSTGDTPLFNLLGGIYQITAVGFTGGSATLYQIGPDGTTWLSLHNAFTTNSGDTIYIPPGRFKWTIANEANVSVGVTRVPAE